MLSLDALLLYVALPVLIFLAGHELGRLRADAVWRRRIEEFDTDHAALDELRKP